MKVRSLQVIKSQDSSCLVELLLENEFLHNIKYRAIVKYRSKLSFIPRFL
jgi:hypothetical protein